MTNYGKCLLYKLYSFLIYAVPMTLLFILNRGAYKTEASIFGFWGYVILGLLIIAFKGAFLEMFKKRTVLSVSAVFFVFSLIMLYMAKEMVLIAGVSLVASILQSFVGIVEDVYARLSWIIAEDGTRRKNPKKALPDKDAWREAYGFIAAEE